jgi:hypothetical protein
MELYLSQTSLSRFQALQYKTVPSSVLRAKVRITLGSKFRFTIKIRGKMIVQYRVRKRITNKNRVKSAKAIFKHCGTRLHHQEG